MTPARLDEILDRAATKRILVIGDLMLDEFVWGKVGRISPEAPVPVVEVSRETSYPGGAANVARNLREFIGHASVIGLIGKDRSGNELRSLLEKGRIETGEVIQDPTFRTIVKTRIIARQQQVVRVDREELRALTSAQFARVTESIRRQISEFDAVVFEDYGKGFLSSALVQEVAAIAWEARKIVTADPNPRHQISWSKVTAVKPNRSEAFQAAGIPWSDPTEVVENDEALIRVGQNLLAKWDTQYLLITLGEQGMMLFGRDGNRYHTPTRAQQVFDVSGAGDTAIALFTLALCCGATGREAADIANHASAVVVEKLGTATVSRAELRESFEASED